MQLNYFLDTWNWYVYLHLDIDLCGKCVDKYTSQPWIQGKYVIIEEMNNQSTQSLE